MAVALVTGASTGIGRATAVRLARDPGTELVLESTVNGRTMRELLVLFVYPGWWSDTIRVVEYVAEKPTFEKEVEGVRKSLATLRK